MSSYIVPSARHVAVREGCMVLVRMMAPHGVAKVWWRSQFSTYYPVESL